MSGRSHDTSTQAVSLPCRPDCTLVGRRVMEEPQHTYTGGLPCRPDCTQQVTASGKSRDTRTQAVFPAAQTTLSRSPCQGRPRHTYTGGLPCWPDRTWQVVVSGRSRDTDTRGQPCGQITLINILQAHLSGCNLHPRNCKSPQLYPERNGQRKRIVRQTKGTITGKYLFWVFFATDVFFSTDEEYGSLCFSRVISICSRQSQRGV